MFNVWINDGSTEMPNDEILYVVSKEGIFLKKKVGIVESCTPVTDISILNPMESFAKLDIPQIPNIAVRAIVGFFKEVYTKYKSEAIVLLYYNQEKGSYRVVAPEQTVSPASLEYTKDLEGIPGFDLIGTIHSHSSMSAFHSGTDDADEASFDGLHITFGNVNSDVISISSSIVVNSKRFKVNADQYLEGVDIDTYEEEIKEPTYGSFLGGRMMYNQKISGGKVVLTPVVGSVSTPKTTIKSKLGFKIEAGDFPESWMENVSEKTWATSHQIGFHKVEAGETTIPFYQRGWGSRGRSQNPYSSNPTPGYGDYDYGYADHWWDWGNESHLPVVTKDNDEDYNPCKGCMYRHFRADLELKDLVDSVEGAAVYEGDDEG